MSREARAADLHVVIALLREADRVGRGLGVGGGAASVTMGVHDCASEVLSLAEAGGGERTHYKAEDGKSEWDCVDVRVSESMISLYGRHSKVVEQTEVVADPADEATP